MAVARRVGRRVGRRRVRSMVKSGWGDVGSLEVSV